MKLLLPPLVVGAFLALWTSLTGLAVGLVVLGTVPQLRTYAYAETTGTVIRSEIVKVGTPPRSKAVMLEVEFSYRVDGDEYVGRRYAYGSLGSNEKMWSAVRETVPPGAEVPVYFNPNDPADAVLLRGLMGYHLFLALAMMPHVIVAVGGWAVLFKASRPQFHPGRIEQTESGWRVRLPEFGRAAVFLLTALIVSFVGLFAFLLGLGTNPPVVVMLAAYAGLVAVATMAATKWSSYPILEIDSDRKVLIAPDGRAVPFVEVKDITVRTETIHTRNSRSPTTNYHVTAVKRDDGLVRLGWFNAARDAEAMAGWVRERMGGQGMN